MSRAQSSQIANQGMQQSATNFQNAQSALNNANSGLQAYTAAANNFANANPYNAGGAYATDMAALGASTADASNDATQNALKLNAMRTGENTAGYATALAENQRAGARNLQSFLAQQDQNRLAAQTAYNQQAVQNAQFAPDVQSRLYGTSAGAANSSLGTAANASANNQSFWDQFTKGAAGTLGNAAGGAVAGAAGGLACWVAIELYGAEDFRTHLLRYWIFNVWNRRPVGKIFAELYLRFGERAAGFIRTRPVTRKAIRKFFDRLVTTAKRELHG